MRMGRAIFSRITNLGLLSAVCTAFALATLVGATAHAQGPAPTDDEVNQIARQLYCPVCESTPLDVCPTEACRQWRELIRTMLAEGKSEAEIKQYFVEHYGARVLAEPPNRLAAYLVPALAILLGAFMLFRGFQMWMTSSAMTSSAMTSSATEASAAEAQPQAQPNQDPYIAKLEEELKKQK